MVEFSDSNLGILSSVAAITALSAWLVAESKTGVEPHPNDIKIFEQAQATFDGSVQRLLESHDFYIPFQRQLSSKLRDATADWVGPRYQFADRSLQKRWSKLVNANEEFVASMGENASPEDDLIHLTVRFKGDQETKESRNLVRLKGDRINNKAENLAAAIQDFEKHALAKLKVTAFHSPIQSG